MLLRVDTIQRGLTAYAAEFGSQYSPGAIDGIYGPRTRTALSRFISAEGSGLNGGPLENRVNAATLAEHIRISTVFPDRSRQVLVWATYGADLVNIWEPQYQDRATESELPGAAYDRAVFSEPEAPALYAPPANLPISSIRVAQRKPRWQRILVPLLGFFGR